MKNLDASFLAKATRLAKPRPTVTSVEVFHYCRGRSANPNASRWMPVKVWKGNNLIIPIENAHRFRHYIQSQFCVEGITGGR